MKAFLKNILALWSSTYSKYYLLAIVVVLLIANMLGVQVMGAGKLDSSATEALGTWFSGMLTVITIAIAAAAFREDRRQTERELKREMALTADQAREAAGSIFCWITFRADQITGEPLFPILRIANHTNVPAYFWKINFEGLKDLYQSNIEQGPILPGMTDVELRDPEWTALVRASRPPRTSIAFRAQDGNVLSRSFDGSLCESEASLLGTPNLSLPQT